MSSRSDDSATGGPVPDRGPWPPAQAMDRILAARPATLRDWSGIEVWFAEARERGLPATGTAPADLEDELMACAMMGLVRERGGAGGEPLQWRLRGDGEVGMTTGGPTAASVVAEIIEARPALVRYWAGIDPWLVEAHARGLTRTDAAKGMLEGALHAAASEHRIRERQVASGAWEWRLRGEKSGPPKADDEYPWEVPAVAAGLGTAAAGPVGVAAGALIGRVKAAAW